MKEGLSTSRMPESFHINSAGANSKKYRHIIKEDLLDRVAKSVVDFTSVFAGIEIDPLPFSDSPCEEEFITAFIGFEGACNGVAWASCSESFAELMASRLKRIDPTRIEEGKRAAMTDMITILGGDIRLLLSPVASDIKLSEISVLKTSEFDSTPITGQRESIRCTFRHINEHIHAGVMICNKLRMPNR